MVCLIMNIVRPTELILFSETTLSNFSLIRQQIVRKQRLRMLLIHQWWNLFISPIFVRQYEK